MYLVFSGRGEGTKMTSKCKTCGHDYPHIEDVCQRAFCKCEKFEPEDEMLKWAKHYKQKKGCGKEIHESLDYECGKGKLCPSCKNQSPSCFYSENNKDTPEEVLKSEKTTSPSSSGSQSPQKNSDKLGHVGSIPNPRENEDTFNLSDKMSNDTFSSDGMFFMQDVKEFIRQVDFLVMLRMEKAKNYNLFKKDFDKLAGSKLLKGEKLT